MKTFFIAALPRSRTTWLSVLLTTNNSFCFHELFSQYNPKALQIFQNLPKRYEYIGSADTNSLSLNLFGIKHFPDSAVVVIQRSIHDVFDSILKAFAAPYGMSRQEFESAIWNLLYHLQQGLDIISETPGVLTIQFHELAYNRVIEKIWRHCIPTIEPDTLRIMQLQQTKMTVKHEDLTPLLEIVTSNLCRSEENNLAASFKAFHKFLDRKKE